MDIQLYTESNRLKTSQLTMWKSQWWTLDFRGAGNVKQNHL